VRITALFDVAARALPTLFAGALRRSFRLMVNAKFSKSLFHLRSEPSSVLEDGLGHDVKRGLGVRRVEVPGEVGGEPEGEL
jgi:hypothetical protein